MLLLADWVIPVSSAPIADGGVRVVGGVISEVGPAAQLRARYEGEEVRTFPGCALLPGFVNSHTHLELSAFRGLAPRSGFGSWMLDLVTARRKLDRTDFEASALWGAREAARCGITSLADTSYDGLTVARAAAAAGLRARVYQEVFGLDDSVLPRTLERYEAVMTRLCDEIAAAQGAGAPGAAPAAWTGPAAEARGPAAPAPPLIEAGVSPHAPYTVSRRLYHEAARFARRAGLRLATHVAESPAEVEYLERGTGPIAKTHRLSGLWTGVTWTPPHLRPLAYVAEAGVLSPDAVLVHAVEVTAAEVATLAASGAAVAHCPRSNARLRCNVAPVAEFLAAGVPVGLGTDSLASNDSLDMFAEMRAALAGADQRAAAGGGEGARPRRCAAPPEAAAAPGAPASAPRAHSHPETPPPATLTAEQVLRMATLEGARALGWGQVTGSLEAGKSADLIAVSLTGAACATGAGLGGRSPRARRSCTGAQSPEAPGIVAALVESVSAAQVCMTMVAGLTVFTAAETEGEAGGEAPGFRAARAKLGLKA